MCVCEGRGGEGGRNKHGCSHFAVIFVGDGFLYSATLLLLMITHTNIGILFIFICSST